MAEGASRTWEDRQRGNHMRDKRAPETVTVMVVQYNHRHLFFSIIKQTGLFYDGLLQMCVCMWLCVYVCVCARVCRHTHFQQMIKHVARPCGQWGVTDFPPASLYSPDKQHQ